MLTLTIVMIIAAAILAIASAAGKCTPICLHVAVILLCILAAIHYIPLK